MASLFRDLQNFVGAAVQHSSTVAAVSRASRAAPMQPAAAPNPDLAAALTARRVEYQRLLNQMGIHGPENATLCVVLAARDLDLI